MPRIRCYGRRPRRNARGAGRAPRHERSLDRAAAPACRHRRAGRRGRRGAWQEAAQRRHRPAARGGTARPRSAWPAWFWPIGAARPWSPASAWPAGRSMSGNCWRAGGPAGRARAAAGRPARLRKRVAAMRAQARVPGRRPQQPAVAAAGARGAQPPPARHGLADRGHAGRPRAVDLRDWPMTRRP